MSKYISSSFNKCYCCLSLRAGVFLSSFCSLTAPYLVEFAINYTMSDYLDGPEKSAPLPDRYFRMRVPYLEGLVDIFSVIRASTDAIGMIGSYKKSPKLIKYHKNLLYFDVVSTPFTLIECLWTASLKWEGINVPDDPDVPESWERDMKVVFIAVIAVWIGTFGMTYAHQIYEAYVARKYEKYLLLSGEESKEK